jgi:hypothetical protein
MPVRAAVKSQIDMSGSDLETTEIECWMDGGNTGRTISSLPFKADGRNPRSSVNK